MTKKVSKYKQATPAWRFYLVIGVIACVYLGLVARTAYIQVIEPDMFERTRR